MIGIAKMARGKIVVPSVVVSVNFEPESPALLIARSRDAGAK